MAQGSETRRYARSDSVVFLKTKERWGGLSNMAGGYTLYVNRHGIFSSEALYQACRFPHRPEVQEMILAERSPMTAKMRSKPYRTDSRPDWDAVRVTIMRWCLRVKLAQNWNTFGTLLLETGELPIVEESRKDPYWGAMPVDSGTLEGRNVLGRLLMELRQFMREVPKESLLAVDPPALQDFLLLGEPIGRVGRTVPGHDPLPLTKAAAPAKADQPSASAQDSEQTSAKDVTVMDFPRLIEHAFPLKQASLDSVHEKNVRHGHISTLHIWPARRPLAASRAALLATLLPDPGTPEKRRELCEKIAGKVVKRVERKKMPNGQIVERIKEDTEGGILHWGRETENAETLEWFRQEIRKAYGGRAPKVLDPFSGGGAIPLEAMRLGCESTAIDINPVAAFILKCTLEYPQRLAGQRWPLPGFVLDDEDFMDAFYKGNPHAEGQGKATKKQKATLFAATKATHAPQADASWHVRAWGQWVLDHARKNLARFYPAYADFEPVVKGQIAYEHRPMTRMPARPDGTVDVSSLNAGLSADYMAVKANPRWIAKPTVAYLWARTVTCKNCRATIPILKTLWLCRKEKKRILLTLTPNAEKTGVVFGIQSNVPVAGGNNAQRREHDKRLGAGTMTKAGARCPCCQQLTMTKEDIQLEGRQNKVGLVMTAVITDGPLTKEYRLPTPEEVTAAHDAVDAIQGVFGVIPGGVPSERIELNAKGDTWCVLYGKDQFDKLFTPRQLLSLGVFCGAAREAADAMRRAGCPESLTEAVVGYIYCCIARLADRNSEVCTWQVGADKIGHTFTRYALPFTWDFVEVMPWADSSGGFGQAVEWVAKALTHLLSAVKESPAPKVLRSSAIRQQAEALDLVITDPPYYDAIGYAVVMDFFAVWLRRTISGIATDAGAILPPADAPKWDAAADDGELVDDANRFGGDKSKSKSSYESGMAKAFKAAHRALAEHGRMVIVFAHKEPDAWETLVSAMIQSGFVVDASWPIMTERSSRMRSMGSAALSSSVWLVCKKRPETAKAGWDNSVLEGMRQNIRVRLREYWDAGIRGPDFVWAATGPAMEAFSRHPVVKKADQPGQVMTVTEFLNHVRRMVVDYVVGQVLVGEKAGASDMAAADRLDEITAYYLLHRHDFGLGEAPSGTCILYAVSCGLSDQELVQTWDLLAKTGSQKAEDEDVDDESDGEEEPEPDADETGSKVRLKTWAQRKNKAMGYEAPNGRSVPLIDRVHRLMHLWKAGDVHKVDEYLDEHGMRRHELFKRLLQSLIELSEAGSDERSLLESLSNHIGAKGTKADADQLKIGFKDNE